MRTITSFSGKKGFFNTIILTILLLSSSLIYSIPVQDLDVDFDINNGSNNEITYLAFADVANAC